MYSFVSCLFHLLYSEHFPRLLKIFQEHDFYWFYNILIYGYIIIYLTNPLMLGIYVGCDFSQL